VGRKRTAPETPYTSLLAAAEAHASLIALPGEDEATREPAAADAAGAAAGSPPTSGAG